MSISATQRARLGIFVAAGIVLACLLAAIPLGLHISKKDKTFLAYFKGESLSGLEVGAQVKFSGVPIGKITRISYDPHDLTKVKTELKIQEDFPMKNDMYAQTGMMGITGLKYVEILGGTNAAPLLKSGDEIQTRQSLSSQISGKAEAIIGKVELLLNHLNQITEPDSLRSVKAVLANLTTITGDFRTFFGRMGPELQDMSGSATNLIDRLDSISLDIKAMTSTFNKAFSNNRIGGILGTVDSTTRSIKTLSENMTLMVRQSREDFSVSLQNLREALENANGLMRELSENPSLLIRTEQQKEREIK
jgi:phospholipid/cholesterol/gamma-HCH transport system substrate-binding protein